MKTINCRTPPLSVRLALLSLLPSTSLSLSLSLSLSFSLRIPILLDLVSSRPSDESSDARETVFQQIRATGEFHFWVSLCCIYSGLRNKFWV